MQEVLIWGVVGWIEFLNFGVDYDVDDILLVICVGLFYEGIMYVVLFYGESLMVMYCKDLMDVVGVFIVDNDSWDNVKVVVVVIYNLDVGVYGVCLCGKSGWGDNMVFIIMVVNFFGGVWFDKDFCLILDSDEWKVVINFYVDLLGIYGFSGFEGNFFNEILVFYNEGKCGMWIDVIIVVFFLEVDGVVYVQFLNVGNLVGVNWFWVWVMVVLVGFLNVDVVKDFIEWVIFKEYV